MKIINKIILISTITIFSWIFIFSFFYRSNVYYSENSFITFLISIPIILLWTFIFLKLKKYKKDISIKKEVIILIIYFILVSIIQYITLKQLDVIPHSDYGVIYDNALKYATTGSRTNAMYIEYFQLFPNNIFMFFMMLFSIKVGMLFHISALNSIHLLNMFFIDLSLLLIYLTVRKLFGKKEAIFSLIITFFFQALFIYTPIVYSDTLSLFIGILFVYLYTFIDNKINKKNIILFILIGLLAFIGKSIKVTSLIVLIALVFNYFLKNKLKNSVISLLIIGITFLSFNTIFNKVFVSAERFSFNITEYGSYPITHWIMMGIEDKDVDNSGRNTYGGYNVNDYEKTKSFKTGKEARKYNIEEYFRRVKKYGVVGYTDYLTHKNVNIWTDGYYFSNIAVNITPDKKTKLRDFITKDETKYYNIYFNNAVACAFLIMLIGGSILKLKTKKLKDIDYLRLSLIGILIFLSLWEGRSRYLVNFIPIFIVIIVEFLNNVYEKYFNRRIKHEK